MKLTDRQKRFCDEYLIDLNATQAAIRAGYSEKTASRIGPELLGKSCVSEHLSARIKDRERRTDITQDRVLKELAKIAFDKATDYSESRLKYNNKIKSLELLGKHLGLFDKAADSTGLEDLSPLARMLQDDEDTND